MNIVKLRRHLLSDKKIKIEDLENADINSLCDDSLRIYFNHCLICQLNRQALKAGRLLDKYSLPRRGNIVDNMADSFLSVRASRIANR
jgi:hypothetical protein